MYSNLELRDIYHNALITKFPNVDFKLADSNTIVATTKKNIVRISLDNFYREYKDENTDVRILAERYVNSLLEVFEPKPELDLKRIVPVIKPIEYLKEIQIQSGFDDANYQQNCVYEEYNDELLIVYAEDTDTNIKYLFQKDIQHINFEEGALKALAIQNIDRMLTSIQKKGTDGVYMIIAGGDYEVSIILIDGIITKENFNIGGDIVIAIPNRDMLLVTGSEDLKGLSKVKQLAADTYKTGSHNLSPYLFKWNGSKFIKFDSIFA